ncbi:Uncharacterized protein QTN25_002782 [Entamoeba marina]
MSYFQQQCDSFINQCITDFNSNFENFRVFIDNGLQSNFDLIRECFRKALTLYPLYSHSKLWKFYLDVMHRFSLNDFLDGVGVWLAEAPPSPSNALFVVEKLLMFEQSIPANQFQLLLIDIIEKHGQAINVNKLWETLIQKLNNPITSQLIQPTFQIYSDLYPPYPDNKTPTKLLMRSHEIQIQSTFLHEIKHGKKLLLQKNQKQKGVNTPFVKTYLDLLDNEYKRIKRTRLTDVTALSFGVYFYYLEKVIYLVIKLFPDQFQTIYTWMKRYGQNLLKLSSYIEANAKRHEYQQFPFKMLFDKRIHRFCKCFEKLVYPTRSLSNLDTSARLFSNHFKLLFQFIDPTTLPSYFKVIDDSKQFIGVSVLPLRLQLLKLQLHIRLSNATQLELVDLDNIFNQFYDSYEPKLLSELEIICKSYMNYFVQLNMIDNLVLVFEALLGFPGEKRKSRIWQDYADTLFSVKRHDLVPDVYYRGIPNVDLKDADNMWHNFHRSIQPEVPFDQFKSTNERKLIPPQRKQFVLFSRQTSRSNPVQNQPYQPQSHQQQNYQPQQQPQQSYKPTSAQTYQPQQQQYQSQPYQPTSSQKQPQQPYQPQRSYQPQGGDMYQRSNAYRPQEPRTYPEEHPRHY